MIFPLSQPASLSASDMKVFSTSDDSLAAADDHNPKQRCRIQDLGTFLAEGVDHTRCSTQKK
jgi:hypothetical protein